MGPWDDACAAAGWQPAELKQRFECRASLHEFNVSACRTARAGETQFVEDEAKRCDSSCQVGQSGSQRGCETPVASLYEARLFVAIAAGW